MYGYGGWDRDFTMPFTGGDTNQGVNGVGIFHIHVGMAGYGVYAFTGSQTIIGGVVILKDPM